MRLDPPAHLQPLLAAFVDVTGIEVSMTYARAQALTELHDRGMTAEDVRAVLVELKRRLGRGMSGYTEASLTFRRSIEDVDLFEERALQLRKRLRKPARTADTAQTRELADGSTVTVLAPAQKSIDVPRADFIEGFEQLKKSMKGGQ